MVTRANFSLTGTINEHTNGAEARPSVVIGIGRETHPHTLVVVL